MPEPTRSVVQGASEASIDQVNIWMRSTPWYQQMLRQWGQDPGHPTLRKWQSDAIRRAAQANGVVIDEGHIEVDNHGNLNPIGHKLRNTLIVIGVAAATIATMGAAGAFAGGAGATSAAAGGSTAAAAGGGTLAASTTVPLMTGTIAGGTGIGAGAGGTLAATAIGSGMVGPIAGGTGVGAGAGSTAAAAAPTLGAWDAAGNFTGPSTYSAGAGSPSFASSAGHFLSSEGGSRIAATVGSIFTNLYNAHAAGNAADKERAYLEAKDRQEQANWEKAQAEQTRQFNQAQSLNIAQWNQRQALIEPYRRSSMAAGQELSRRLGLPAPAGAWDVPNPPVPDPNAPGGTSATPQNIGTASTMFLTAVREAGLDPVAVQGHGQVIADAVNKKYPGLGVTVDPKTDAVVWPGIGPLDVTVDSGKGGWSFRPSGIATPAAGAPMPLRAFAPYQPFQTTGARTTPLSAFGSVAPAPIAPAPVYRFA